MNSSRGDKDKDGGSGGWRRSETVETMQSLVARAGKDGVKRYDKQTLLGLFKKGTNAIPDDIKYVTKPIRRQFCVAAFLWVSLLEGVFVAHHIISRSVLFYHMSFWCLIA
jgi:hypothetical protein